MRKLPVYLVLDVSASMQGIPIESVKRGVKSLVEALRKDPYAIETAYLSVITFNHEAYQEMPLTELAFFQEPKLEASGQTGLGSALNLLSICIENEVQTTSFDSKGDWKPLVFLMTDGAPTDDWRKGLASFRNQQCGLVVACAAGPYADIKVLREITNDIVSLDSADENSIAAFFKWVSASVSVMKLLIATT